MSCVESQILQGALREQRLQPKRTLCASKCSSMRLSSFVQCHTIIITSVFFFTSQPKTHIFVFHLHGNDVIAVSQLRTHNISWSLRTVPDAVFLLCWPTHTRTSAHSFLAFARSHPLTQYQLVCSVSLFRLSPPLKNEMLLLLRGLF